MSKLIWVDTTSGTWGDVDGKNGRLLLVNLDEVAPDDRKRAELDAWLEDVSDSDIVKFADEHGVQVGGQLTLEGLGVATRMLMPEAQFETDNDGQLVIYTGVQAEDAE